MSKAIALALILSACSGVADACCIGIYYALDPQTAQSLRGLSSTERLTRISTLAESVKGADKLDVDESWDAMHRALTDGTLTVPPESERRATSYVVLGGESLIEGDEWIVVLSRGDQVRAAARAIQGISRDEFRKRYDRIDAASYDVPLTDDDFAYTWQNFAEVKRAFARWAREGKWVLFVAAQ